MNDNAEVGEDAVVAALAFVKAEARIPDEEIRWKHDNMLLYQELAGRSATTMQEVEALTQAEPNRRRIDIPGSIPLSEMKLKSRS